jgi:hypothetical protein
MKNGSIVDLSDRAVDLSSSKAEQADVLSAVCVESSPWRTFHATG